MPSKTRESLSIVGAIKGETEKALRIKFSTGEAWIPKSCVISTYDPKRTANQTFIIEEWILKKKDIV